MTRPRYSLAQLMAILVYLGFGFAALRNADEFWATATYSIAVLTIAAANILAISAPMPELLPVTGARFPTSSRSMPTGSGDGRGSG
jgi:hypothetical protein